MYKNETNSIKSVETDRNVQMCRQTSYKIILMCNTCVPASAGEIKFPLPAKGESLSRNIGYYRREKIFPIVVLVGMELNEPPAEKALLFLQQVVQWMCGYIQYGEYSFHRVSRMWMQELDLNILVSNFTQQSRYALYTYSFCIFFFKYF